MFVTQDRPIVWRWACRRDLSVLETMEKEMEELEQRSDVKSEEQEVDESKDIALEAAKC